MSNKTILAVAVLMFALVLPASAVEIRGTVVSDDGAFTWNATNFAAFYYDIDKNIQSETLNITVSGRTIAADGGLQYTAIGVLADFSSYKALGKDGLVDGKGNYSVVGFMGDKYVAVNSKANKLAKLVYEMDETDKVTLVSGEVLKLGAGYELKINAVDAKASPRQAWLSLSKDGKTVDEAVIGQKEVYVYTETVLGEEDSLIFTVYVDSIFSGTNDMIQMKHAWLIDNTNAKEIKTADTYGLLKVVNAEAGKIVLENDNTITLSQDTVVTVMDNLKLKVADASVLRFYPKIDVVTETVVETPKVVVTTQPQATVSATSTAVQPAATQAPSPVVTQAPVDAKPVETQAASQAVPVTTNKAPGFESLYAIAGLVAVAFLVLRQRK